MKPRIYRRDQCIAIRLFTWGKYNIEIVYAPKGCILPKHTHPHQDIEKLFLWGNAIFYRIDPKTKKTQFVKVSVPKSIGRLFTINSNHIHWFEVSTKPLIFVNFSRYRISPTSSTVDFHEM